MQTKTMRSEARASPSNLAVLSENAKQNNRNLIVFEFKCTNSQAKLISMLKNPTEIIIYYQTTLKHHLGSTPNNLKRWDPNLQWARQRERTAKFALGKAAKPERSRADGQICRGQCSQTWAGACGRSAYHCATCRSKRTGTVLKQRDDGRCRERVRERGREAEWVDIDMDWIDWTDSTE